MTFESNFMAVRRFWEFPKIGIFVLLQFSSSFQVTFMKTSCFSIIWLSAMSSFRNKKIQQVFYSHSIKKCFQNHEKSENCGSGQQIWLNFKFQLSISSKQTIELDLLSIIWSYGRNTRNCRTNDMSCWIKSVGEMSCWIKTVGQIQCRTNETFNCYCRTNEIFNESVGQKTCRTSEMSD